MEKAWTSLPRRVGVFTSFITLGLTSWLAVDALLRLSVGISLLLVRIARRAVMTGFASASDADSREHNEWSNLPQLTLHA